MLLLICTSYFKFRFEIRVVKIFAIFEIKYLLPKKITVDVVLLKVMVKWRVANFVPRAIGSLI